ncbi:transcriptional regulator [Streptomyces spiroverticillatus]|uniref:Transcriptional regulator n=1 Tax=Streptomyces finlayi TaxID=67296 RepID=A0A918WVH5_9ACTN|nr:LCP family protein [Streptomyces finlayi]GHA03088.1 transcriptional regulator [Streptomyces spiroverticillatus]GHC87272.1 transcriptional regulator [Streptomyces finlayi]
MARSITKKQRTRGQRIRRALCWVLAGVVVVGGGVGYWAYSRLDGNLSNVDIDAALGGDRPGKDARGAQNLLVLGSDSRSGGNKGLAGGDTGGTARSDTAMVVHIPEGRKRATAVSIPRDTLVSRPACAKSGGGELPSAQRVMFNSVYTAGGPACVVKTVEAMSGIRMDHYVEIDFAGFKELVDALGGVTVTTERAIDDKQSGLKLAAGTHRLDGTQSLAFVRTRHGIGDGSDLGRIGLQQKFILALLAEVERQDVLGSPTKLFKVADAATKALTTDSGIGSLTGLAGFAKSLRGLDAGTMETVMLPVAYDKADPNRVVAAEPQAGELWDALRAGRAVPASAKKSPAGG